MNTVPRLQKRGHDWESTPMVRKDGEARRAEGVWERLYGAKRCKRRSLWSSASRYGGWLQIELENVRYVICGSEEFASQDKLTVISSSDPTFALSLMVQPVLRRAASSYLDVGRKSSNCCSISQSTQHWRIRLYSDIVR